MNAHGWGKDKTVGVLANLLLYFERTELASVEFSRRSSGLDLASQKPYLVASFESRIWNAFLVCPVTVLLMSFGNRG